MCHRVVCARCGKPTWAGCGRHVEEALRGVPVDQRCSCPRPKSLWARIFGRRFPGAGTLQRGEVSRE